ncbi:MAG: hypothetical protein ACKO38_08255 [Planctomycetota bacterium]
MMVIAFLLLFSAMVGTSCPAADDLEKQLLKQGKKLVAALQEKGYKNVGILKFRVKKGKEAASDSVGPLNLRLAEKLELALILGNPVRDPLGIVHAASNVAASIPGGSHLSKEGRSKLFTRDYPLAWGNRRVVPDAFVMGTVEIRADLSKAVVSFGSFDRYGADLQKLSEFTFVPDLEDLVDFGESFSVRGLFDQVNLEKNDEVRKDEATKLAVETALLTKLETPDPQQPAGPKRHPLSPDNPDSLVSLEIRYNNRPVPIEFRNGIALVPEPLENQQVAIVIGRRGDARPRLGVVLKVNGENTLYRERLPDNQCTPWVFEPRLREFGVTGFQISKDRKEPFNVLSRAASKEREMDYGEHVGTISITVFPEQTAEYPSAPILLSDDGEDFATLTRGGFPKTAPESFEALRAQLTPLIKKGLVVPGTQVDSKIQTTQFKADSIPVMSATIRYYRPQR